MFLGFSESPGRVVVHYSYHTPLQGPSPIAQSVDASKLDKPNICILVKG